MKRVTFLLIVVFISHFAFAQRDHKKEMPEAKIDQPAKKTACDSIVVDLDKAMINGKIGINSPLDSVKKYLPCVTKVIPMGDDAESCRGGEYLEKQGIIFNPEKGFMEFSETTTAKLPIHVFGMSEDSLAETMPGLAQVSDINSPSSDHPTHSVYLYPKPYGCLAIWVLIAEKRVIKIQMHNKPFASAFLCVE